MSDKQNCPYCQGKKPLGVDGANDGIRIVANENDTEYAIESDSWEFSIDYCPKCGLPLSDKAKPEEE